MEKYGKYINREFTEKTNGFKSFGNILSLKHVIEKDIRICEVLICTGTGEPGGLQSTGSQSRTRLKRLSSSSRRGENKAVVPMIHFKKERKKTHIHITHVKMCLYIFSKAPERNTRNKNT